MADSFQPKFADLVRNFTATQGTGNFVLGSAPNGFTSFADAVQPGERFYYSALGMDKPAEREVGRGTMQPDGTISREPIGGTFTNFSNGTKSLALIAAAEWFARIESASLGSGGGGGGGGGAVDSALVAESRAGLSVAAAGSLPAILTETGRVGLFLFDSSDCSASVAADTAQGIYVAPSSDPTGASGAWVRELSGPVDPRWFGIISGDAGGANGATNSAAWDAMCALLRLRGVNATSKNQGLATVRFPTGYFEFAQTIELTGGTFALEGGDNGFPAGRGTILKFPDGVTGIRTQRFNTSGASGPEGEAHIGGDSAIIRRLALIGSYSGVEAEAHGIQLRSRAHVENVHIADFEGDGIHCAASAISTTNAGNTNNSYLNRLRIENCRNGVYVDGADANIWTVGSVDCSSNRQAGFWDSSFLGNTYVACHSATNGVGSDNDGLTVPATVVSHSGNRYYCIAGQEGWASANAPTGTTGSNTGWAYLSAGGPAAGKPAWFAGIGVRAGGSYLADSDNAKNVLCGCYAEGGQGKAQLIRPTMVLGGILAGQVTGTASSMDSAVGGYFDTRTGWRATYSDASATRYAQVGESNGSGTILLANDSNAAPNSHRLKYSGSDIRFDYGNLNARVAFWITGPNTGQQFGSGAAISEAFYAPKLMIGDAIGNSRQVTSGTAAPTAGSWGKGAICLNTDAAANGIFAWVCTAAGSPGSWAPVPLGGQVTVKSGTAATAVLADSNAYLSFSGATAIAFTVPPAAEVAFPIGTVIELEQAGAGALNVVAGAGVTVNSRGGALALAGQHAVAALKKVGADSWTLTGDIA